VGEGEATILTEVTDYDPMYVYFNLNERDLLNVLDQYRKDLDASGGDEKRLPRAIEIPLFMGLANEEGFPHEGSYDFGESSVDPDTGTMQLRGIFDNPGPAYELLPGLFGRIRLPLGERQNMTLVSEQAIGTDQGGTFLLVVNSKNVVERRAVETGQLIDGLLVIEEGIRPQDWVVVNGIQRARPGRVVTPEQVDMAAMKASALAATAEAGGGEMAAAGQP
jgi:membrane fusion protein (multidrug efflux system)